MQPFARRSSVRKPGVRMWGAGGVLLLGLLATVAGASLEQFDTWDLGAEELDDEYGMDLHFAAFSPDWERQWRASDEAVRTSMGCVTRERWEMLTEVRLRRQLSPRVRFAYAFVQEERLTVDDQQHAFGCQVALGGLWLGAVARPHTAKERHDFGFSLRREWPAGYHVGIALTFEDILNDFWTERSFIEERQRIDFLDRAEEWRLDAGRHWSERRWIEGRVTILPESRRLFEPAPSTGEARFLRLLDGSELACGGEVELGAGGGLELRVIRKEARLAELDPASGVAATDLRRLAWSGRARLAYPVRPAWRVVGGIQLRRNREQEVGEADAYRLQVRDIMAAAGVERRLVPWATLELGFAHQDVAVDASGEPSARPFTHGSRREDRIYITADLAWRGVRLRIIETLEVDGESYDVVGVHDKGFVQIQATF